MGSKNEDGRLGAPRRSLPRPGGPLVLALVCALALAPALVRGADRDALQESTGIRYPEGFDLNTAGELEGSAGRVTIADEGPVRFRLAAEREEYTVLTVPRAQWSEMGVQVPEGASVSVKGSKTVGRDGNLYVVAQELKVLPHGRVFTFRDAKGAPLWTKVPPRPAGASLPGQRGGGTFGPMRPGGLGGVGGGMGGGMRHGGR